MSEQQQLFDQLVQMECQNCEAVRDLYYQDIPESSEKDEYCMNCQEGTRHRRVKVSEVEYV